MPGARCTRGLMRNVHKECAHEHTGQRRASDIPCAMALRLIACSCVLKICQNVRTGGSRKNRPSLDLSPSVLEGVESLSGAWDRSGVFLNPDSCMGFEPGPSKKGSWMMAQNDLVVAGIDVAKDKVDVCIRSLSLKRAFANTQEGRRELASWLRRRKVGKTVMEASGGYEREWAKALRATKIEVRIVDPKRVRSIAMP